MEHLLHGDASQCFRRSDAGNGDVHGCCSVHHHDDDCHGNKGTTGIHTYPLFCFKKTVASSLRVNAN